MNDVCFYRYPYLLQERANDESLSAEERAKAAKDLGYTSQISKAAEEYRKIDLEAENKKDAYYKYRKDAIAEGRPTFGYSSGIRPPFSGNLPQLYPPSFRCQIWDARGASVDGLLPTNEDGADMLITNFQWPETGPDPSFYKETEAARATYNNFKVAYDFFLNEFGRDSLDGLGQSIVGFINLGHPDTLVFKNAYWLPILQRMYFGAGQERILDTVGHELMHGITGSAVPKLVKVEQPGALNESISDCFGCMIKQYGASPRQKVEDADWIMWDPQDGKPPYIPIRSLKDPSSIRKKYPKHMQSFVRLENEESPDHVRNDSGWIHFNCGIPNHAFYLASTALKDEHPYSWDRVGKVWYHAVTGGKMKNDVSFQDFANLTYNVAGHMFNNESNVKEEIGKAWEAVGITPKV